MSAGILPAMMSVGFSRRFIRMRSNSISIESVSRWPRWVVIGLNLLFVLVLGMSDYIAGREVSLFVFYVLPVLVVTWFIGQSAGIALSIVSAIVWFVDEVIGRPQHSHAISYWDVSMNFIIFLILTRVFVLLKNALEREKVIEQEKYIREIEIAREVQLRLFPQVHPLLKSLQYSVVCKAARDVAGDYYDFFKTGNNRVAIALGDVSGKGISAALLMATLCGMVRSQAPQFGKSIHMMVAEINRLLYASTHENRFASLFFALYDDISHTVIYVNGGHNPPLLFRHGSDQVCRLLSGGMVVGASPSAVYQKSSIQLAKGDILVFFTDGLIEARNGSEEEFNEERLIEIVRTHMHASAETLKELILSDVSHFVGKAPQHDDLTLIVAKAV